MMNRTQIYLPPSYLRTLKKVAQRQQSSIAEVIRTLIRTHIIKENRRPQHIPLSTMAKQVEKFKERGPKDLANQLDRYLYGAE